MSKFEKVSPLGLVAALEPSIGTCTDFPSCCQDMTLQREPSTISLRFLRENWSSSVTRMELIAVYAARVYLFKKQG